MAENAPWNYVDCRTGKVPHPTREQAQLAADRMNARTDNIGVCTTYLCTRCSFWHIGREYKQIVDRTNERTNSTEA